MPRMHPGVDRRLIAGRVCTECLPGSNSDRGLSTPGAKAVRREAAASQATRPPRCLSDGYLPPSVAVYVTGTSLGQEGPSSAAVG